jgi:hypothetical protein
MLTLYGACAVTFMMLMYALESRGPRVRRWLQVRAEPSGGPV